MHVDLESPALPQQFGSDVCIVGGGTAGILLAARLASRGVNTHLLEAGGLTLEDRSQDLYQLINAGHPHAGTMHGRFRTFGGSSTRWGGGLLSYEEEDLNPPASFGLPHWPIASAELEAYYQDVQDAMGVGFPGFSDELLRKFRRQPPFASDRVRVRLSKASPFSRRNVSQTCGKECLAGARVTVFTHANVTAIHLNENGTAVRSITAANYGRATYSFTAQQFVLSAGTIETCRLLLASTDICSFGVGNGKDQVGRYFHDHVSLRAAEVAAQDRTRMIAGFGHCLRGGTVYKLRLEATEKLRRERGIAAAGCEFPIEEPHDSGPAWLIRRLRSVQEGKLEWDFRRDFRKFLTGSADIVRIAWAARAQCRRYVSPAARIVFHLDVGQRPNAESRIRLSDEVDAIGMRRAILGWQVTEAELDDIRVFREEVTALLVKHGYATTAWSQTIRRESEPDFDTRCDAFHMMGGARMGTATSDSVVDAQLRVHGLANLYIASCAVFPTGGSSNPTFTLLALALRLADHLASTMKGNQPSEPRPRPRKTSARSAGTATGSR
jgi:choline dehydrogenase-like flavoprotein